MIGADKQVFEHKIVNIFYPSVQIDVVVTRKNRLIETVLLSTHNICFGGEIRKIIFDHTHPYLGVCLSPKSLHQCGQI